MPMHANSRTRRKTGMLMDWTGGKMYYRYILIAESSFSLPPHILHGIVDPSFAQFSSSSSAALHCWIHSHHPLSSAALHYLEGLNWSLKLFFQKKRCWYISKAKLWKATKVINFPWICRKLTKHYWPRYPENGSNRKEPTWIRYIVWLKERKQYRTVICFLKYKSRGYLLSKKRKETI